MFRVRLAISAFLGVLLSIIVLGWRWTSSHQPPALATGSHVGLAMSAAGAIYALVRIWQRDPKAGSRQ